MKPCLGRPVGRLQTVPLIGKAMFAPSVGRSVSQSVGRSVVSCGREAWIKQNLIRLALALAGSGRPLTTALEINIKHVI